MLSHVGPDNQAGMVDVGAKQPTARSARARATLRLPPEVLACFADGEYESAKGPVFHTAKIAGIQAAKKTSELIPLCHVIPLDRCNLDLRIESDRAIIECDVAAHHRTGVEMEALTAVAIAALTVYDMCKALSHDIVVEQVRLVEKRGGKHDFELRP